MSIADSGSDLTFAEGLDDVASPGGQRFWIGVRQVLVAAFLLVVAGALWELAKLVTGTGDRTMPHVWDTLRFLGSTTSQNENYTWFLIRNAWSTAKASLVGLLVGTAFGLTTGISIARSKFVGNGLMPLIVAAQAVPILAFKQVSGRRIFHIFRTRKSPNKRRTLLRPGNGRTCGKSSDLNV